MIVIKLRMEDLRFAYDDDEYGCLCTFPHNYSTLDKYALRDLATLGALVVLTHQNEALSNYIPSGIPIWILKEIDRVLDITESRIDE